MLSRHPRLALTRSTLIVAGTCLAIAGVLRGRVALRQVPLQTPVNEQTLFLKNLSDGDAKRAAVGRLDEQSGVKTPNQRVNNEA
jgi:hypothetical protein